MYGYEASTGLGGLAAQAPAGNRYLAGQLAIRSPGAMIVGDVTTPGRGGLPYSVGQVPGGGVGVAQIGSGGMAVERDPSTMLGGWREILDFHNSPAPWILIAILLLYGYVHVSYRQGRAVARVGR